MASRLSNIAPPGSLLKSPRGPLRKPSALASRERDREHLEAVRQCPCLRCGRDPAGEAAHVRMTKHGHVTGIGVKPDDRFCLSLCPDCHREQHQVGEAAFYAAVGIDPLRICEALWRVSPSVEAMRAACFVVHVVAGTRT